MPLISSSEMEALPTIDKQSILWYNICTTLQRSKREEKTMDSQKLLTVYQVAEILQVSRTTVYRRIQTEELPAVKLGRRQVRISRPSLLAVPTWRPALPSVAGR